MQNGADPKWFLMFTILLFMIVCLGQERNNATPLNFESGGPFASEVSRQREDSWDHAGVKSTNG